MGNARVAILNWLFTRQQRGQCILRIEDTDLERNVAGAENQLMEDLLWLGLDWDEGPRPDGPDQGDFGPYRQTQRFDHYTSFTRRLQDNGHTFECYCTQEELAAARAAAIDSDGQASYPGTCRNATSEQVRNWQLEGRSAALRFRMPPDMPIVVEDIVYGPVTVNSDEIGDFIIQRSDGLPTYNFAVVVDDILMEVTHVIRGVGHLSNTPRQVALYQALGLKPPVFAHIPMVLGPDRQKLSKRHGAQALAEYRAEGYHPDALVNYLSLLGWSSPTGAEFLPRAQLMREISLERIGNADVVFDPAKLRWLSAKHIELMSLEELAIAVAPFIEPRFTVEPGTLQVILKATRTHLARFADITQQLEHFYPAGDPPPMSGHAVLQAALGVLGACTWEEQHIQTAFKAIGAGSGAKGKALYEPLRVTVSGHEHGPPLAAIMLVQGRAAVLARIKSALGQQGPD